MTVRAPAEESPAEDKLPAPRGVIVVDHGSRRAESNDQLLDVVRLFAAAEATAAGFAIVEPAHMELASPTIAEAFARCVARGARSVIVFPYFLAPGRHWREDIPALAAAAAAQHQGIPFVVTPPLGLHPALVEIMHARIAEALAGEA